MKSTVFTTAFALVIAVVSATDVPACITTCETSGIAATKCSSTDHACICSDASFASGFIACIKTSCSPADQQTASTLANSFCSSGSSSSSSSSAAASSATHGSSSATGSATQSAPTASSSATFNITQIPSCADACAVTAFGSTSCDSTDYECICKDNKFIQSLEPCVKKGCDSADQQKMLEVATALCSPYGVNLNTLVSASASATSVHTTAANSTKTRSGSATATPYGNSTSSTSGSSTSESGTSTESTTAPPTSTGTATTSSHSTTSTGGAAKLAGSGFVAAAIGAAFFML